MALTKEIQDWLTITPNGVFEHRRLTQAFEDGELLGERNHRTTYTPDMKLADLPPRIAAIANVVWTPAVIAAYKAQIAQEAPL